MKDPSTIHPVHAALEQLDGLSKSSQLSDANVDIDEGRRLNIDRIFYITGEARKRLSKIIGVRANISVFNNIYTSAQAVKQELDNYIANKSLGHIDNALSQTDQGLAIHMAQLPPSSVGVETEAALEAFRKMSRSAVGELKANEGILKQKIDSLSTSIGQQESRIQQEQEQAAISRSELTAALTDAKSTFQNLKSAMELEFKGLQQEDRVTLEKHLSDSETIVNKYISEIESKKKEAASIVQSVGDILTTGTYKDTAESEARLANTFRLVTIVLFSIGILIVVSNYVMHAIAAYNQTHFEETPWFLLSRFATALAVALPALYTARESARHRTNADRARQRELELTTLGPFIELLPDLKKQEIRDRLTDRYFGGEVEKHEIPAPIDAETLAKLATSLAKLKTVQ